MQLDFIGLYDKCFDDVYRYVFFKVGNRWDADDLVSEVFRKAYENFAHVTGNVKSWLFTIARNTVIDFYRRKKDVAIGDDLELYTYPYSFEEDIERRDTVNCLKKSLRNLPKDELELINLRYFSDMKFSEIGEVVGKTESSVKMKCFRITNKLRELVKHCVEG